MVGGPGEWMDCRFPKITQDQPDGVEGMGYIANMCSGATAGFKFFDCKNVTEIAVRTRGDANGCFVVRTAWDGAPLGVIPLGRNNEWKTYRAPIQIPDGIQALYFTFEGSRAEAQRGLCILHVPASVLPLPAGRGADRPR